MWVQSVNEAISQVENQKSGIARIVATLPDDVDVWSQEDWEYYNLATSAIVEPFSFPGAESDEADIYTEATEANGFGMVKANLADFPSKNDWIKVIDLLERVGY